MNPRERTLAIVVAVVVVCYGLYAWAIEPMIAAFDRVDAETAQVEQDLESARVLIDNDHAIRSRWAGYEKAGLSRTLEQADGDVSRELLNWAERARLASPELSTRSYKLNDDERFGRISRTLNATGTIEQVRQFLLAVRYSPFPLRVDKCVIEKRNDDTDRLSLSLTLSTVIEHRKEEGATR